ncbi:histone-lysine N-methyltransferase SETMAR [Elysia marginata]|uniref:Histone-lysine N-methyltransferase SETMAR n=1 Tax=Elysia marginata TaxID=1093978 RepID=A0AAV4JY69_9GAST|nr:histone-lysine N-methyltransferase SETMAR [Elysia marginata]
MATPTKDRSKLEAVEPDFFTADGDVTELPVLTEDHKLQRVETSRHILLRCQQDNGYEDTTHIGVGLGGDFQAKNNLFDNLVTGGETWVYLNTPETKRDYMTWRHPSSPQTKKFKVHRSAAKVMSTVFSDAKSVILLDILPQGQCINAAQYCSTLDRLRDAIRRKRPGLLRRGVVLQYDNATPHSANLTQQWLQRYVGNSPSSCPQSRSRTL